MNNNKRLILAVVILSITFFAELVGGLVFKSLSLVSDSFHVFADIFALVIAFTAMQIARVKVPTDRMTYGYHRLEVFSAIINGIALIVISVFIMIEAYERYSHPVKVQALSAMLIAVIGLIVNLSSALILRTGKSHKMDINIRSAYLHLLGDSAASVAVIIGMITIALTGLVIIDAIVAFLISLLLLFSASRVLIEGAGILAQKSPTELDNIRTKVRQIDGVVDIDDLRLWQLCSHIVIGTAHIVTSVKLLQETAPLYDQIEKVIAEECAIRHLTLHFETPEMSQSHSHEFDHQHGEKEYPDHKAH
jgi:cobalt-zinc-cadmium efflux system protein